MAEIKDKTVTLESLSVLHEHNKNTYMPMVDPTGSGTMEFNGSIKVNSIRIGPEIKLVPTNNSLEIIFDEDIIYAEETIPEQD